MFRHFGVELEFKENKNFLSSHGLEILEKCQFPYMYSNNEESYEEDKWVCKPDPSCGFEIVTPILKNKEDLIKINYFLHITKQYCKQHRINKIYDRKCGLHIHICIDDYSISDIKNLLKTFFLIEKECFYPLLPPYRHLNKYCMPLQISNIKPIIACENMKGVQTCLQRFYNKNSGCNLKSFLSKRTAEFRYFHMNLDFNEIGFWVLYLQELIQKIYINNEYLKDIKIKKDMKETARDVWTILFNEK